MREPPDTSHDGAFDFAAVVSRLAVHWRHYLITAVAAALAMYGLTFLMPSWYRSTVLLLPPEDSDQLAVGLDLQRALLRRPSIGGIGDYYTPSDIFKAILSSRSVQQPVIERAGLQLVYRKKSIENTLMEFRRHVRVAMLPDGTISVGVEDRSRDRAAQLANALVEELNRFNVVKRNFQARRTRIFLERRVVETDSLTRVADSALREYQEKHHVVAPQAGEAGSLAPIADLMARKMALEVRLSVLRSYLSETNEDVLQVRTELERLRDQINRVPAIETDLGRLIRDARLYQQAYAMLAVQLDDARLRETMDMPTVAVLDPAIPAERRARPIRRQWVVIAMALSVLTSALWNERPRPMARRARSGISPGQA